MYELAKPSLEKPPQKSISKEHDENSSKANEKFDLGTLMIWERREKDTEKYFIRQYKTVKSIPEVWEMKRQIRIKKTNEKCHARLSKLKIKPDSL